jgi:hypothetical protein
MFHERRRNMTALAFRESEQSAFAFDAPPAAGRSVEAARRGGPFDIPRDIPCEIPLRSMDAHAPSRFTAWRGRSGRRYVASAFPALSDEPLSFTDAVLIAVDRERRIVAVRDSGPWGLVEALERWRDEAAAGGAEQLHVHLIAGTAEERRAVVADLTPVH